MDPMSLEWGNASSEFFNEEKKTAVHVFKHDLTTPERLDRALRFARARLEYLKKKLPDGSIQEIWYDDRGQQIPDDLRKKLRSELTPLVGGLVVMSEEEG